MSDALEQTLRRLKAERDEADRRYNDALTALDRVLPEVPTASDPGLPLDEHQLAGLNEAWNTLPGPPAAAGRLQQRLTGFIWRTIAPYLQRQLTFNSLLVDHLNRNAEAVKRAHQDALRQAAHLRGQADALRALHGRLMQYLQQITAYVDTRDREASGATLVVNAALSGVAEAHAKYHESFAARQHRLEAREEARRGALDELQTAVGVTQQAIVAIKRQLEGAAAPVPPPPAAGAEPFAASLDAYKYVGFEHQFRGDEATIRERQQSYVQFFADADGDVLDVGCGRGEFIDLLKANGIGARGIDVNSAMVEHCRARGLDVAHADAVGYLASLPGDSLGGLFAAQVVEHLDPAYLLRFLELAAEKLRPGARIVLETLNPACWTAFFESYIRDITHRWPLHPETLRYLVLASGFPQATIEYRSPLPEHERLQSIAIADGAAPDLRDLVETVNGNAEKLNARMFTFMDYAVIALRR